MCTCTSMDTLDVWRYGTLLLTRSRPASGLVCTDMPPCLGPQAHLPHWTRRASLCFRSLHSEENSPYRLIIRTVHCTETLVCSSMLCVVCCWCCEVCGVPACCLCPDLFVCVPGILRLPVTRVGLVHCG